MGSDIGQADRDDAVGGEAGRINRQEQHDLIRGDAADDPAEEFVVADSYYLGWSGKSNQIYKALVQLHGDGLVEQETVAQESYPPRKLYRITGQGRRGLQRPVLDRRYRRVQRALLRPCRSASWRLRCAPACRNRARQC